MAVPDRSRFTYRGGQRQAGLAASRILLGLTPGSQPVLGTGVGDRKNHGRALESSGMWVQVVCEKDW